MYERFYHLRERPFSLTPDPEFLYPSRVHAEALSHLRYGIEGHASFIVVTGAIGSGKTTLLQTALRGLDASTQVARLVNTQLSARELVEAVMLDFGLDVPPGASKPHLIRALARFLVEQRAAGRLCLIVVDEAQNLSTEALEEVRMLSNLETEKSKLVQIALVGQPALRAALRRPELQQLAQRVSVSYHLGALDADDTAAYIRHRLARAAVGAPLEFPDDACELIHVRASGVPRTINVVADAVLLFGYGEDRRQISADLVRDAIDDLEKSGVLSGDVTSRHASPRHASSTPTAPPPAPAIPPAEPPPAPQRRIVMRESPLLPRPPAEGLGLMSRVKRSLFGAPSKPVFEE